MTTWSSGLWKPQAKTKAACVYRLLRRRLPLIVIVDAEADPDYTFEGIATWLRRSHWGTILWMVHHGLLPSRLRRARTGAMFADSLAFGSLMKAW